VSLLDPLLALLGLDFDFSVALSGEAFHPITETLVLGSRPRPEHVEVLTEQGITHVVSCLAEDKREAVAFLGEGFETLFLPLRDRVDEDVGEALTAFFAYLQDAGRRARVLVHCEVGVSRSATLVTAQVMRTERRRFYDAYRRVRSRRPQVLPNVGFATQLQRLEHRLFGEAGGDGPASLTRYLHEVCRVPVEIDVLQGMLEHHDYDALPAIRAIFGGEIPRVVQGARSR
jgi:atypical dual specificity phosphatase